jgi:hypothetical protein
MPLTLSFVTNHMYPELCKSNSRELTFVGFCVYIINFNDKYNITDPRSWVGFEPSP